jgi:hypothetical protein
MHDPLDGNRVRRRRRRVLMTSAQVFGEHSQEGKQVAIGLLLLFSSSSSAD